MFHNAAEYHLLYPDGRARRWAFCAPRLEAGMPQLMALRARLETRAAALGYRFALTRDPDLHLVVDGKVVRPAAVADNEYRFSLPPGAAELWLASRSTVPAVTIAGSGDLRRLGVAVTRLVLHAGEVTVLDTTPGDPAPGEGFHANEGTHRWTDGLARLPEAWLRRFPGPLTLTIHLAATELDYLIPTAPATRGRPRRRDDTMFKPEKSGREVCRSNRDP